MKKRNKFDIEVFFSSRDSICAECSKDVEKNEHIILGDEWNVIICLSCADLDHLVYLPAGDAALTRRSRKHSTLSAVVLSYSASRKRNERQGLLVEQKGLELAEKECLSDTDYREKRKERDAIRRAILDKKYINRFADEIRKRFPGCPKGTEKEIAEYACLKYSGRVGRSAFAKDLSEAAIILAVRAHIRHEETDYDGLLAEGYDRYDARSLVKEIIEDVLSEWRKLI